jgi:hypothetical protein
VSMRLNLRLKLVEIGLTYKEEKIPGHGAADQPVNGSHLKTMSDRAKHNEEHSPEPKKLGARGQTHR